MSFQERTVVGKFAMPHNSLVHMFSNTPSYAVIVLYPVAVSLLQMASNNFHPLQAVTKLDTTTKIYLINLR
jgi:carotenoid cleavage dioxygenase-like enzyme